MSDIQVKYFLIDGTTNELFAEYEVTFPELGRPESLSETVRKPGGIGDGINAFYAKHGTSRYAVLRSAKLEKIDNEWRQTFHAGMSLCLLRKHDTIIVPKVVRRSRGGSRVIYKAVISVPISAENGHLFENRENRDDVDYVISGNTAEFFG
jgi:hypothetical protein